MGIFSCQQAKNQKEEVFSNAASYNKTVSPDGKIESSIILHSRQGIRAELNINKNALSLWLSPQAGKNNDIHYRNFSNRDDHTSVFDQIGFPELAKKEFIRCDYDPFHSVLYFKGQTLHLATLIDKPVVLLWVENEEVVDIKTDKQDSLLERLPRIFGVRHPDRGLTLDFYAALGGSEPSFQHQQEIENHRSMYARTVLHKDQFMVFAGELSKENVKNIALEVSSKSIQSVLDENERLIAKETLAGSILLKNQPEMQKLYDINKRHLISVQDASGAIHAALRYVYYLIWITDGTVTTTSVMQTGNKEFLRLWCDFILANPTTQTAPPNGSFYGQLVSKSITKREEFGSLCAVLPAFMHWTLTGDETFVTGENLKLLEEVVDWVDRYCFDKEVQAIGTYYLGGGPEDPFLESNDYGHDAAVGSFMNRNTDYPKHEGKPILRVYEFHMNLNQYNMYLMLASLTKGEKEKKYIEKANVIKKYLMHLDSLDASAIYRLKDAGLVTIKRKSDDPEIGTFAIQHNATAYFMPNFSKYFMARTNSFKPFTAESILGKYGCATYGRLAGLDIEFVNEKDVVQSLLATIPYNIKPSKFIPMPYTMVEVFGAEEGSYHDIRPQAFSAGPFQAAVANLAVKTMPFGIAVRGANTISKLSDFHYLNSTLDIQYAGSGSIQSVYLNDTLLSNTLQIPDEMLLSGKNSVKINLTSESKKTKALVYSTVRLLQLQQKSEKVIYKIRGYCQNVLVFKNLEKAPIIKNESGLPVKTDIKIDGEFMFVEFLGKGIYFVEAAL